MQTTTLRTALLALFVTIFSGGIWAQQTHLDFILNLTPTRFNYGADQDALRPYRKSVNSWQIGASLQTPATNGISVVSELYFMMKGGKLEAGNPLTGAETRTRLYTVEMPLLVRAHIGRFYLNAGGAASYSMGGRIKTLATSESPSFKEKIRFDGSAGSYKRWDAGLQAGMGYAFPCGSKRVAIDVRYHHGLVNIFHGGERYNRYFVTNILISNPWKSNPLRRG